MALDEYRMTLGELRQALAEFPDDAIVVVDGYEGGYEKPTVRAEKGALDGGGSHCGLWSDEGEHAFHANPGSGVFHNPGAEAVPVEPVVVISRRPDRDADK